MTIETPQKYEDALAEIWELVQIKNPTQEQLDRIVELAEAIQEYEKAKWGWND